jgi:hypothetical protein
LIIIILLLFKSSSITDFKVEKGVGGKKDKPLPEFSLIIPPTIDAEKIIVYRIMENSKQKEIYRIVKDNGKIVIEKTDNNGKRYNVKSLSEKDLSTVKEKAVVHIPYGTYYFKFNRTGYKPIEYKGADNKGVTLGLGVGQPFDDIEKNLKWKELLYNLTVTVNDSDARIYLFDQKGKQQIIFDKTKNKTLTFKRLQAGRYLMKADPLSANYEKFEKPIELTGDREMISFSVTLKEKPLEKPIIDIIPEIRKNGKYTNYGRGNSNKKRVASPSPMPSEKKVEKEPNKESPTDSFSQGLKDGDAGKPALHSPTPDNQLDNSNK